MALRSRSALLFSVLVTALATLAAPAFASVLFDGDFDPTMSPWTFNGNNGSDNSATLVTSPSCDANAVKLTIGSGSGTHRAQLDNGPRNQPEGSDVYSGWATFIPTGYPSIAASGWHVFMQWFNAPYSGSPPVGIGIQEGTQRFELNRNVDGNYGVIWTAPSIRGEWVDFVVRRKVSKDASEGFVELWLNGVKQTFTNGQQRYVMRTNNLNSTEAMRTIPTHYTHTGNGGTLYHDEIRDGTSYEDVATNCRPGAVPPPVDSQPTADFTTSDSTVAPGENVTFDASVVGGDGPLTYEWSDDVCASYCVIGTGDPMTRSFTHPGVKEVRLRVTDADGDTSEAMHPLTVEVADIPADAAWTPPAGARVNTPTRLDGSASTGDAPITCVWEFMQNNTETVLQTRTGCVIDFSFVSVGEKQVRLRVTDADLDVDVSRQTFQVGP